MGCGPETSGVVVERRTLSKLLVAVDKPDPPSLPPTGQEVEHPIQEVIPSFPPFLPVVFAGGIRKADRIGSHFPCWIFSKQRHPNPDHSTEVTHTNTVWTIAHYNLCLPCNPITSPTFGIFNLFSPGKNSETIFFFTEIWMQVQYQILLLWCVRRFISIDYVDVVCFLLCCTLKILRVNSGLFVSCDLTACITLRIAVRF